VELSLAMNLSASSWRADSAARNSGDAPKRMSPLPESFSARLGAVGHLDLFQPAASNRL
jgi:hypothetical protein